MKEQNKACLPFHSFQYAGHDYVINIEKMQAFAVTEPIADNLNASPVEEIKPPKDNQLAITSMALFLTQACNLRCVYCYETKSNETMSEKTALQAVDWLFEQSGKHKQINISFFGGEPFLNFPLMKKVAIYAREKADALNKVVVFNVTTNGTVLDEEMILFVRDYDVHILVSMDGPREIHDRQRPFADGQGSYDTILPRVQRLLAVKPKTRVHAVLVDDQNTKLIQSSLQEIGFAEVTLLPASATSFDEGSKETAEKTKNTRSLDGLFQELDREADLWLELIKNKDSEALIALRNKAQLTWPLLAFLHNKKKYYACGAGIKYVAIACSGDIYLCHRFVDQQEYKLGNIFGNHFDREDYRSSPLLQVQGCAACFARYYCAGWCKHDNATACGSIWTPPEEICLLKKHEFELAAVIISQLNEQDRAFLND